jgi:hypothetical protein
LASEREKKREREVGTNKGDTNKKEKLIRRREM